VAVEVNGPDFVHFPAHISTVRPLHL
jgi:hypothetical protein